MNILKMLRLESLGNKITCTGSARLTHHLNFTCHPLLTAKIMAIACYDCIKIKTTERGIILTIRDIAIALIAATSRIILARSQRLHRLCNAQAPK
jgi:hypothetical protein